MIREIFFFKDHGANEAGKLIQVLSFFSGKPLYEVKHFSINQAQC